jgi:hypothetical protein
MSATLKDIMKCPSIGVSSSPNPNPRCHLSLSSYRIPSILASNDHDPDTLLYLVKSKINGRTTVHYDEDLGLSHSRITVHL